MSGKPEGTKLSSKENKSTKGKSDATVAKDGIAAGSIAEGGDVPKKKRRGKKQKKEKIVISLWINKTAYEHGILCTFCAKIPAVCHCPECPDFYCASCDVTAHATKKRKGHTRFPLSALTLELAARRVTHAVRYHGHLRSLQKRCRETFKRHFDRASLNYYYYNPVYKTVSWKRPYCLRKTDLFEYMEPNYAASKCQNLWYLWLARKKCRVVLEQQWSKIFDRRIEKFYYAYNGPSKLLPKQQWRKPYLFGKRSFPNDKKPIYTLDVACIRIQRKWRAILMRQYLKALVRGTHDEVWDPVTGKNTYLNRETDILLNDKPKLLRGEAWDPNRIPDWTLEEVSLFLRRIGLKRYVQHFSNYGVDGKALVLLDEEDFVNLNITNKVHMKKIVVEMKRIYKGGPLADVMSDQHKARRDRIRRQKMYNAAAVVVQRGFRSYRAKCEKMLNKEVRRVRRAEDKFQQLIIESNTWWTELDIPAKKILNSGSEVGAPRIKALMAYQTHHNKLQKSSSLAVVPLPPIKTFGKRRDYLSLKGWGRRGDGVDTGWQPSPAAVAEGAGFIGDKPLSTVFVDKLLISGYDKKRRFEFSGQES